MSAAEQRFADDCVPLIDCEPLPIVELPDPFAHAAAASRAPSLPWRLVEFLATEQLGDLRAERAQLRESLARTRKALAAECAELLVIIECARDRPHE